MTQISFDSCFPHSSRRPRRRSQEYIIKPVFCDDWRESHSSAEITLLPEANFCSDWRGYEDGTWLNVSECPLKTTQTTRLCHCNLPNPHICNTGASPKPNPEVPQESPSWPGQRPRYKRKRVQVRPQVAIESSESTPEESISWLARNRKASPSSLDCFDFCLDAEENLSRQDHKRRRSEESLCSGAEPESPLEPRIDPNWLLFEDLLEEWTSSESTASTPFDYMEASTAMTSPESVEDDEKDEMSTTPIPACSNSADP